MKKYVLPFLAALVSGVVIGCSQADIDNVTGKSDDNKNNAPTTNVPAQSGAAAALGPQIDRAGRPGVSTALIGTFNGDETAKNSLKSQYNSSRTANAPQFAAEIAKSLAIYDALAGTCGDNKITAAGSGEGSNYLAFATALADDEIYVNSASGNCQKYLGVELGVQGSCGGRIPTSDVIDITYSAVALGKASGVSDGVGTDDRQHSTTAFPFLSGPAMTSSED